MQKDDDNLSNQSNKFLIKKTSKEIENIGKFPDIVTQLKFKKF